ncbi:TetR/AcrR family transcriptional regulator [Streptomyces sp. A5-4]|uniref:TetR/AcrR family transcriptional regulator n=1 Tax=Streptomyces sp. A5-4 TaxID=3384771 RepID=UPI003DA7C922
MGRPVVPFGKPRGERADAVRNRERLLETARELIAEQGVEKVTMDCLAERARLGKGTVFRRFGTRAGIFKALLDADERRFQEQVISGPPPLGPGADPMARLVAYGRARIVHLLDHHAVARAALDRSQHVPAGDASVSQLHIRMLLGQASA